MGFNVSQQETDKPLLTVPNCKDSPMWFLDSYPVSGQHSARGLKRGPHRWQLLIQRCVKTRLFLWLRGNQHESHPQHTHTHTHMGVAADVNMCPFSCEQMPCNITGEPFTGHWIPPHETFFNCLVRGLPKLGGLLGMPCIGWHTAAAETGPKRNRPRVCHGEFQRNKRPQARTHCSSQGAPCVCFSDQAVPMHCHAILCPLPR